MKYIILIAMLMAVGFLSAEPEAENEIIIQTSNTLSLSDITWTEYVLATNVMLTIEEDPYWTTNFEFTASHCEEKGYVINITGDGYTNRYVIKDGKFVEIE